MAVPILKVNNIEKNDIEKQPWEKLNISLDWSDELGSGATISAFTTLVYDASGSSVGTTIIAGVSEASEVLTIGLQGGVDGTVYTLTSRVTSDQTMPDGNLERFEVDVKLTVKDTKFF
ncbi:MAG: phage fiber-tail adaptor protein [Candidatus Thorarchaeota archaeon]|jgi:hypothetical protein